MGRSPSPGGRFLRSRRRRSYSSPVGLARSEPDNWEPAMRWFHRSKLTNRSSRGVTSARASAQVGRRLSVRRAGGWGSTGLMNANTLANRAATRRNAARPDHSAGGAALGGDLARRRRSPTEDRLGVMGHATPERPGAAQIILSRYTHVLPKDIEKAREARRLSRRGPESGLCSSMKFRSLFCSLHPR